MTAGIDGVTGIATGVAVGAAVAAGVTAAVAMGVAVAAGVAVLPVLAKAGLVGAVGELTTAVGDGSEVGPGIAE